MPEIATGTQPPPAAVAPAPAPAPAPAAPPPAPKPQSPPPVTTSQPVSQPARDLADAFAQLDKMAGEDSAGNAPAQPRDPPAAPKLPAGQKPEQPPAPEPPEEAPDETPPEAAPKDNKPPKLATLRQHYDKLKADYDASQKQLAEWKAKAEAPKEDPELPKVKDTLAQREKRLAELEEEQRFSNFERSDEYKQKFEAPFINAYQQGRNKTASLKVTDMETGETRQGKPEDFDALMRMTDDDAAADAAAQLFGNKAPMVMYHRERVQELNGARVNALDEYRKTGGEREKARQEAMTKSRQEIANTFNTEVKAGEDKYKQWSSPIEGDAKSAEILAFGKQLADRAFGQPEKDADGRPVMRSPQEMAKLHAAMRNKAAWFDHAVYLLRKEQAAHKAALAKLKEFEASEPGGGTGGKPQKKGGSTWDQVNDQLTRLAR